jgi:hypothetical protein
MKKLEKQDEMIIHHKIDGNLSEKEEERFNELIRMSSEARRLYQNLLSLHLSIKHDAKKIPSIDFSQEIMKAVKNKRLMPDHKIADILSYPAFRYAAFLLIGLFLGSFVTYLVHSTDEKPEGLSISGTMANTAGKDNSYHEDGTGIKIQEFESGEFRMITVAVNTRDTVQCIINCKEGKSSDESADLLFSSGKFDLAKGNDDEIGYDCTGHHVFVINKNKIQATGIRFKKKNKLIYELKFQ